MKQLLALKEEYKKVTGQDYKPGAAPATSASTPSTTTPSATSVPKSPNKDSVDIYQLVAEQGDLVRKLKTEKAPKVCILVPLLLFFKVLF